MCMAVDCQDFAKLAENTFYVGRVQVMQKTIDEHEIKKEITRRTIGPHISGHKLPLTVAASVINVLGVNVDAQILSLGEIFGVSSSSATHIEYSSSLSQVVVS